MRPRALSLLLLLLSLALAAGPAVADHDDAGQVHGTVEFPTSCAPAVQPRFERAVAQLHSFGYDFARLAFEALAEEDPTCGMALWGAAATYLHPLWAAPTPAELAAGRAFAERAAAVGAPTERERGWIAAIGAFYADFETVDHRTRATRYRDALGAIADRWTDDHEARIFQALMLLGTAPPRPTCTRSGRRRRRPSSPRAARSPSGRPRSAPRPSASAPGSRRSAPSTPTPRASTTAPAPRATATRSAPSPTAGRTTTRRASSRR